MYCCGWWFVHLPHCPIPVQRPFQIVRVDVMELPLNKLGNKYVLVFQDHLTMWPMVYPMPDQKLDRNARILTQEEVFPFFRVPEALLSDRGTHLLSHLMLDVCKLLGITKLNTTAYHPQCNTVIEQLNQILKNLLRKHTARFGPQWDHHLPAVLWAYRNSPDESTGEKPSFLLLGVDLCSTEAAPFPPHPIEPTTIEDYREELITTLFSARELATKKIQLSQNKSRKLYDQKARQDELSGEDWVLVRFPQKESGKNRKLSKLWHGPYCIVT